MRTRRLLGALLALLTIFGSASSASAHRDHFVRPPARAHAAANIPAHPWCGSLDARGDASDAAAPDVKVVYAHPADLPSRLADAADGLQHDIELMSAYVAEQSGGRKTVRLDLGTECDPASLDIQTIDLALPAASYLVSTRDDGVPCLDTGFGPGTPLGTELRAALNGPHLYLVYADGLSVGNCPSSSDAPEGIAYAVARDDRPGPVNASNRPGNMAVVFGPAEDVPEALPNGYAPQAYAHELFHLLGAVQSSAPHSNGRMRDGSPASHCTDGYDLMCYPSGGRRDRAFSTSRCALLGPGSGFAGSDYNVTDLNLRLDCGSDDYFGATSRARRKLHRHWNTYDSRFLVSCLVPPWQALCAVGAKS